MCVCVCVCVGVVCVCVCACVRACVRACVCVLTFSGTTAPRFLKFGTNIGYDMLYCVREKWHPHAYHSLYLSIFMPPPFSVGSEGWGMRYSITAAHTYVRPSCPVRNTTGFSAISFEKIGILD